MDVTSYLAEFQTKYLGYQFANAELLITAITHSLEKCEKDKNLEAQSEISLRLAILGEKVLKLAAVEYVIYTGNNTQQNAINWAENMERLLQRKRLVSKKLFSSGLFAETTTKTGLTRFSKADWSNLQFAKPYCRLLDAIFGAVFLDSNLQSHNPGPAACLNLFQKLWETKIGQQTSYKYTGTRNLDTFEFLGDAVLDVVLEEYFWSLHFDLGIREVDGKKGSITTNNLQQIILQTSNLNEFEYLGYTRAFQTNVENVESCVGAIYLASGYHETRKFVRTRWQFSGSLHSMIETLQKKLGYRFRDQNQLLKCLTYITLYSTNEQDETVVYFNQSKRDGLAVLKIVATEVACKLAVINKSPNENSIKALAKKLCSDDLLQKVCNHLDMKILLKNCFGKACVADSDLHIYAIRLLLVFGLVWDETKDICVIRKIFYRLWGPHLVVIPDLTLKFYIVHPWQPLNNDYTLKSIFHCILANCLNTSLEYDFQYFLLVNKVCKVITSVNAHQDIQCLSGIGKSVVELFVSTMKLNYDFNSAEIAAEWILLNVSTLLPWKLIKSLRWIYEFKSAGVTQASIEKPITEMIIAAIYLDSNLNHGKGHWVHKLFGVIKKGAVARKDQRGKTKLEEKMQAWNALATGSDSYTREEFMHEEYLNSCRFSKPRKNWCKELCGFEKLFSYLCTFCIFIVLFWLITNQ